MLCTQTEGQKAIGEGYPGITAKAKNMFLRNLKAYPYTMQYKHEKVSMVVF